MAPSWKPSLWAVLALVSSLALPASGLAQNRSEPIRAAIAEVRAEEAKGRPLSERMRGLVAQIEEKKKEYDATEAQLKSLLDRYGAKLAKYEGQVTEYSKLVDAYNAKCGGKDPLPTPQFRACMTEKGELAGRKIELDSAKAELENERKATETDSKAKTARLAAISKEWSTNLQAWEKAQVEYKAIFARIEAIKKRLIEHCVAGDQAKDPFAVRLCVGAGWDSQKKDFAALTDLPPPVK